MADSNADIGYIVVQTHDHGSFRIPIDNETIKSDFDGNIDQPLELSLKVELDHEDSVKDVIEVHSVSLIDEQIAAQLKRCRDRLNQVSALGDGWHDGDGLAPSAEFVAAANKFLSQDFALCDLYRIYPTDEGGVLFEIEIRDWDLSVEFLRDGKVQFHGIEIKGERTLEVAVFDTVDERFLSRFNELTK